MASPAQLVEAVSLVTGVPFPTVVDIDRKLVKGNLRTKGGRGLHAAQMTSVDASRLLTAILASPQSNAAADAVSRYARTEVDQTRSSEELYAAAAFEELSSLQPDHSFVDALASLISALSRRVAAQPSAQQDKAWPPRVEVFAFTRATRGRIRLSGLSSGRTASVEYGVPPQIIREARTKGAASRTAKPAEDPLGDLEQSRRVTEQTILAVAQLFGGGFP